jgi:hypothetical protein
MTERTMEDFERAMDGVSVTGNVAMSAIKLRYRATILSEDKEHVVCMIPTPEWVALVDQIDMLVAVVEHFHDLEEGGME